LEPNPKQRQLIENRRGIYLVDAGAGTGKTFSLSRRYASILKNEAVSPSDILLITFTNNAAGEMKERVINCCDYDPLDLQEAPISTFHSLCHRLLLRRGFNAPFLLGIKEHVTSSTSILQNEVLEKKEFRRFLHNFIEANPDRHDFLRVLRERESLLGLIKSLAAKGIIPLLDRGGHQWYQQGEDYLDGHFKRFYQILKEANKKRPGKCGPRQSDLLGRIKSAYRDKCYYPDAPNLDEVASEDGKKVRDEVARKAFEEDRKQLKNFMHELYSGYLSYCLQNNYLNFGFLQVLAYILLSENSEVRAEMKHRFVMIDEFQDTSEIQFKLTLLLSETNNICVVGDWKQSIYSFQYANVDNIRKFERRLRRYKKELNSDCKRVSYPLKKIREISLNENYRSGQEILDFSERSLLLEATDRENLSCEDIAADIVHLKSGRPDLKTEIKGILSADETEAVLFAAQRLVEEGYPLQSEDNARTIQYGDIAVLTRTRKFGLELQETARRLGVPLAYEGGVELFKTDPAIILLAWLRVLDHPRSKDGWAVLLEEAGYTLDAARKIIDSGADGDDQYPSEMLEFREKLQRIRSSAPRIWPAGVARHVFDHYGYCSGFTDKIVEVVQETAKSSLLSLGGLVEFIEDNIEAGTTYEVDNPESEAITVQTIHAAKGLEYPVVIVADVNSHHFPGRGGSGAEIEYRDPVGLRQKKIYYDDPELPFVYDNWRSEFVLRPLAGEYDEERRLMYVALTRAQQYLYLSARPEEASPFFENLRSYMEVEVIDSPEVAAVSREKTGAEKMEFEPQAGHAPLKVSVHDIMEEPVMDPEGKGPEYGREAHEFAEKYALGKDVRPANKDQENIAAWLAETEGEYIVEQDCLLPLKIDGYSFSLVGIIDLIVVGEQKARIVDYKTDRHRKNEKEYRKQLSVYYHVVQDVYPDRDVKIEIFYTGSDRLVELKPFTIEQLKQEVIKTKLVSNSVEGVK